MPELVIGRALLRILQNLVGLLGFLEVLLRRLIVRITVRMIFHRQTPIGFFQLIVTGRFLDAENFVVIPFCHAFYTVSFCDRFADHLTLIQVN